MVSSQPAPRTPIYVDDEEHLDEIIEKYDFVIVEFFADWCGPCEMIEPILERIADETRVAVARVDVDQHQLIADDYGVQGIPMMVFFNEGEQHSQSVGLQQYEDLVSVFEEDGIDITYEE